MSDNHIPYAVHNRQNQFYNYHTTQLYELLYSLFRLDNLPATWDETYIKSNLFDWGFIGIYKNTLQGDLPVHSYLYSYNYMYRPAKLGYSNTVLGERIATIHDDCEIVYIRPQLNGLLDVVSKHASILANIDASLMSTLYNSRVAHVFYSSRRNDIEAIKKMYDDVSAGNPAVFITDNIAAKLKDLPPVFNNVKNTYIGDMLADTYRVEFNRFLSDVGIDNSPIDKRERLTTDEVNSNNEQIAAVRSGFERNLTNCFNNVNKMFATNIKVVMLGGDKDVFNTNTTGYDVSM